MPPVLRTVFTGEVERGVTHAETATFLDGIRDQSQYVNTLNGGESAVINSVFFGVKPDVLINNTTYGIPIQNLDGQDFDITLDKFQTKRTPITDDELFAITWDKMANVVQSHAEAIAESKFDKAIHAFAPNGHTANTPVLVTSGEDDGTGRKRLVRADIIALKAAFDAKRYPIAGRRLVLSNEHVQDLLLVDQKFAEQYYNYTTGKIANMYSFEIFEYVNNPYYTVSTKAKLSFGAVPNPATDRQASVAFIASRAVKATGITKMYYSPSENDTEFQRSLVNFRHYFIALPSALKCIGALISADV